jgi:hypothetical protein
MNVDEKVVIGARVLGLGNWGLGIGDFWGEEAILVVGRDQEGLLVVLLNNCLDLILLRYIRQDAQKADRGLVAVR